MLIPSWTGAGSTTKASLSRRVNANSQHLESLKLPTIKLIKKGEC